MNRRNFIQKSAFLLGGLALGCVHQSILNKKTDDERLSEFIKRAKKGEVVRIESQSFNLENTPIVFDTRKYEGTIIVDMKSCIFNLKNVEIFARYEPDDWHRLIFV